MNAKRNKSLFGYNGLATRKLFLDSGPESQKALKLLKENNLKAKISNIESVASSISPPTLFAPEGTFMGISEIANYVTLAMRQRR